MAHDGLTVDEAADKLAAALGVDPESILVSGNTHVLLTPDQVEALLERE